MAKLRVSSSVEVDNLIDCIAQDTGESYDEIEKQFFTGLLYPEGSNTFICSQFGGYDAKSDDVGDRIRAKALKVIQAAGFEKVYITNAI